MLNELNYNLENTIQRRIPYFQRGEQDLIDYLSVAGTFLDDFRYSINALRDQRDYDKVSVERINDLARNFGLTFPANMEEDVTRISLRDIVDIFRTNGTEKTLNWIFNVIGWGVEINYAWLLNPDSFTGLVDGEIDYDLFLFGEPNVEHNGTYFYGKDFYGNEYNKIPIRGEYYPKDRKKCNDCVLKTPYIFVQVNSEDYNIFIDDKEDPESGEVFSYTRSEIFKIIQELIDYFLYQNLRPATIAIIIIVYSDEFEDTFYGLLGETGDVYEIQQKDKIFDGAFAFNAPVDPYALGETYDWLNYSDTNDVPYYESPSEFEINRTVKANQVYYTNPVCTRKRLRVIMDMPDDGKVIVQGTKDNRQQYQKNGVTWENVVTMNEKISYDELLEDYWLLRFYVEQPLNQDTNLTIRLLGAN